MRARLGVAALAAGAAVPAVTCGTVDVGDPPADVNACRPSPRFFYERIWPEFLNKSYGGKRCADASCHDAGSPRQLVLPAPTSAPALPLPPDWERIYRAATEQLSCTNPTASALLTRPDGRAAHFGGKLIEPEGAEATLVKMWIAAP
jgi:hypothetical protein